MSLCLQQTQYRAVNKHNRECNTFAKSLVLFVGNSFKLLTVCMFLSYSFNGEGSGESYH